MFVLHGEGGQIDPQLIAQVAVWAIPMIGPYKTMKNLPHQLLIFCFFFYDVIKTHMFGEYSNALVRQGQNVGYIQKINRWLIVLVYKRHIQKCAILPIRPQDAEMQGVMSDFFGIQFIVFVPLPTPYFTSDFKNSKNFEKKNTKIFDF